VEERFDKAPSRKPTYLRLSSADHLRPINLEDASLNHNHQYNQPVVPAIRVPAPLLASLVSVPHYNAVLTIFIKRIINLARIQRNLKGYLYVYYLEHLPDYFYCHLICVVWWYSVLKFVGGLPSERTACSLSLIVRSWIRRFASLIVREPIVGISLHDLYEFEGSSSRRCWCMSDCICVACWVSLFSS
jgi:hypothetical protein